MSQLMTAKSFSPDRLWELEDDDNYAVGTKYDGFREQITITKDGSFHMITRSGAEHTENVPHITGLKLPEFAGTVIDGEGIGPDGRIETAKSVFGSYPETAIDWQRRHGLGKYIAFDITHVRGEDITQFSLSKRQIHLWNVISELQRRGIREIYPEILHKRNKRQYFDSVVAKGEEGVMLKKMDEPYYPGSRTRAWQKVKVTLTWDVVITGFYMANYGKTGKFSGLIGGIQYGFYINGQLKQTGRTSGMTDETRKWFTENQEELVGKVIEVKGQSLGEDGAIRFPRFVQMRPDKRPEECTIYEQS